MQKPNETLKELAFDIERLARLAYSSCPLDMQDSLARQQFVEAIKDPETQHSVRMADCASLQAALIHAMKFESTRQATRGLRHNTRQVHATEETNTSNIKELAEEFAKILDARQQGNAKRSYNQPFPRSNGPRRDSQDWKDWKRIECWNCGERGHIQMDCKKYSNKRPKETQAQGNDE
jgi:hypothetical protein